MLRRTRFPSSYLRYLLLVLGFCVFTWGLQAKLSLYNNGHDHNAPIVAKLSAEHKAAVTTNAILQIPVRLPSWELLAFATWMALVVTCFYSTSIQQAALTASRPIPLNLRGSDRLLRPPPFLS